MFKTLILLFSVLMFSCGKNTGECPAGSFRGPVGLCEDINQVKPSPVCTASPSPSVKPSPSPSPSASPTPKPSPSPSPSPKPKCHKHKCHYKKHGCNN